MIAIDNDKPDTSGVKSTELQSLTPFMYKAEHDKIMLQSIKEQMYRIIMDGQKNVSNEDNGQ